MHLIMSPREVSDLEVEFIEEPPMREIVEVPSLMEPAPVTSPERTLLTAILQRAILDFINVGSWEGARYNKAAEDWFHNESDTEWSFLWICSELDLCPVLTLRAVIGHKLRDSWELKRVRERGRSPMQAHQTVQR
jgi:hypothetical protein